MQNRGFGIDNTKKTAKEQARLYSWDSTGNQPLPSPYSPAIIKPIQVGIQDGPSIQFLMFGDCGGVKNPDYQGYVAAAMQSVIAGLSTPPSFAYILGDVVYFNGDPDQYAPQFYEPYCHTLGGIPIIAFPGNHDGDGTDGVVGSGIPSFMANFCTVSPEIPPGDPQFEYGRHTQTLPSVDWSLRLQNLTIISLWTNVASGGSLYPEQRGFLHDALVSAPAGVPVMLGLHHPPYSVDTHHGGCAGMGDVIDAMSTLAGRWPDYVVSGHVHDQQRFTRTISGQPNTPNSTTISSISTPEIGKQIPYLVSGNGGYHNLHELASDATPGLHVTDDTVFNFGDDQNWGFQLVTVTPTGLSGEYIAVDGNGNVTRNADNWQ